MRGPLHRGPLKIPMTTLGSRHSRASSSSRASTPPGGSGYASDCKTICCYPKDNSFIKAHARAVSRFS